MVNCASCGEENPPKFRLCGYCGAALAAALLALPVREMRKTVTLLFSDVGDSSALGARLDPEVISDIKGRYFDAMAAEITRHGGRVEKYIDFAIVAVFGVPRVHEDDALRAVRAADGMRAALARLNQDLLARYGVALNSRIAVNSGEVVASDDPAAVQKLITFDAAKVAAQLERCAPPNGIHVGEATYRLVRDAVEVEAVAPIQPEGSNATLVAYRLVSARGLDGYSRRHDTPIVGRDVELAELHKAYRQVCRQQAVQLVTVIGDAGVGKSRLVREFADRVGIGARVLRGRCLPYGDGTTFHPLRGMAFEAAGIHDDDPPEAARAKLLALVGGVDVADRLASALGLSTAVFPLPELYWGARKLLEGLASTGPVVAWVDDIHWAAPPVLEMLLHVLEHAGNVSILLLATARHELLDAVPQWSMGAGSTRLTLRALDDASAARVVANLLGPAGLPQEVTDRIVAAASGNPFYVEQMLAMLVDSGALRQEEGRWVRGGSYGAIGVPPTIKALLEARLDLLARADRATLDTASVIGSDFDHAAIKALVPPAVCANLDEHLGALVRRQFVQPSGENQAEGLYRFQHHLLRETAYNSLLKRTRADLHQAYVRWADQVHAAQGRALEFDEILGHHLEQAHRYLRELGPLDDAGVALGIDAARRLAKAGKRALACGDYHAAAGLFKRAAALLLGDDPHRAELLPGLGDAMGRLGDFDGARAVLDEAEQAAERLSNARVMASARLVGMRIRLSRNAPGDSYAEIQRETRDLIPMLERVDAHDELSIAWLLIGSVNGLTGRYRSAAEAYRHSITYARQAGSGQLIERIGAHLASCALLGPTPVPHAMDECERLIAGGLTDRQIEGSIMGMLAQLRAMNGELPAARSLYRQARAMLRDLGQGVDAAATGIDVAWVELLGGDLALAERELRSDVEFLASVRETYYLSSMAALLARVVREQGRDEEAIEWSRTAEAATAPDDLVSQVLWRSVRAPIVARAGDLALAEELASRAVGHSRRAESPWLQAEAMSELASVLRLAGKHSEAHAAITEAISLYTAKGDVVSATRASIWVDGSRTP